jgi:hydrophobic/amphiphilic exporter-1 (mainly G- bacteria), HAE1 family
VFISDFAIKRPIVTVTTMIAIVAFGIYALFKTDVDEFPDIQQPIVLVAVPYPGASPGQVEREVVDRMEEQFNAISGIDQITSTSTDGFAQIVVQYVFSKDPDQGAQDIRDAISEIRDKLPAEMKEPIIKRLDPGELPIVSLALTSQTMSPSELTILADPGITKELRSITGVAQVTMSGGVDRTIAVNVRPADLQAAHVSVADVVNALNSQNLAAPVGAVVGTLTEQQIRLLGRLDTPQDFLQLIVASRGGQLVRLGQVADVKDTSVEARSVALFNGQLGIGMDITKSKGISTTRVADDITARIADLQKTLPRGVHLTLVRDAGVRVRNSVRNVEEALVEGALLTVLVVFLFLNSWRSTIITGLALPVSTIAAFIAVWACGFTLNTMSLLGLSLAIGILIDDAIVVRENIVRHIELGEDHVAASHSGTDEIGLAVTATTFSIVAVFVPVAFMNGIAGQWFKPFALTIACAVLVSLFVSFSLDPMLSAYWPDPQLEAHQRRNALARALDRFNVWFDRQADAYKSVIGWALDHRAAMVAVAVLSFAGALFLQYTVGGGGFIPDSDRSEFDIDVQTPPGSNLDYMRLKLDELGRLVRSHPEVDYTYATVGDAAGSGRVDDADIYVRLVPKSRRHVSQQVFAQTVRDEIARVGGVTPYVFSNGFGDRRKQIEVQLRGTDEAVLTRFAEQVLAQVRTVKGAADAGLSTKGQRPELQIDLNRGLAGTLGVSVGTVAQSLRPAFAGVHAGDWVDPTGKTRDVTVRLAPEARTNIADLAQLPLVLPGAAAMANPAAAAAGMGGAAGGAPLTTIPLGQVATISTTLGPAEIDHLDRDEVITVGANPVGASLSDVSKAINAKVAKLPLPPGVRITQGGQVKDQATVYGSIFAALGLAVMLMYLILVVQFGSFLDPLAIMMSLPLSLIGVVIALIVTHDTLNIMSLIGVILLMGIVAKNAILLIDFAKWSKEKNGSSTRDALIEAGRIRLRPILMTTLALIAGMIPVALGFGEGADFRSPLGRAVIGGVITSTFLTLLVIPTFYEILDEWRTGMQVFFRQRAIGSKKAKGETGAPGGRGLPGHPPLPGPAAGD